MPSPTSASTAPRGFRILIALVISAVLAIMLTTATGSSGAFADGGTATLSGTVTNSITAAPIANVSVNLTSEDGSYLDFATTGVDGSYSFSTIPAGNYTLSFQPADGSNYLMQWWNGQSSPTPATYFAIADGQNLTEFNAALQPGATIKGRVDGADALGTGLANVNVSVQSPDGLYSGEAQTDANGRYSIVGLPADAYYIDFEPGDGIHVGQWWHNQPSLTAATFLVVGAGGTASNYDAHLAVGATISGTVDAAGSPKTPLVGATVTATGPGNLVIQSATTNASGDYTITGLPTASYTVEFQGPSDTNFGTEYWKTANSPVTATGVAVSAKTSAKKIDAVLSPGGTIKGNAYAPGSPRAGLAGVLVSVFSANGGGALQSVATNSKGEYVLGNLAAGKYSVQFAPGGGSDASVEWWGGTFIQTGAKMVSIAAGQTVSHLSQQLIVGSTISGTVRDSGSPATPDGNVEVVLWASDQVPGITDIPPMEAATDASGHYSFSNIGPGKYTVDFGAEGPGFLGQWWKDKSSHATATSLVVPLDQPVTGVNATLAPAIITPGTPAIVGHAQVGTTLTARTGTWKPSTLLFSYQWLRNGVAIPGEVKPTYVPTAADVGAHLSVAVTGDIPAFESQGTTLTATSALTAAVVS